MTSVRVFKYDLTNGMAAQLAPVFLGIRVEAIWHTSVVAYGKEFYFDGGVGVEIVQTPGTSRFGRPLKVDDIGTTNKPESEFQSWLQSTGRSQFGPNDYNLLEKNCNNFTSAAVRFLFDNSKDLADDVKTMIPRLLSTPMGQMLRPMLSNFTATHAGQSEQQQFQGLQQQFNHNNNNSNNNTAPPATSSSSSSLKEIDEQGWDKLLQEIESKPAIQSLNSLVWMEGVLQHNDSTTTTIFPAQSGSGNRELDEKLLSCLAFVKRNTNDISSGWRFAGNQDTLETAKLLSSSLLGELESRWSQETTSSSSQQ